VRSRRRVLSRPSVSRILFPPINSKEAIISLGRSSPVGSSSLPANVMKPFDSIAPWAGLFAYLALLPVGFAVPFESPRTRCALTAPFHPYLMIAQEAVCFLLHFPSDCSALMLSSTGPWKLRLSTQLPAVRTFLTPMNRDAIATSAAILRSIFHRLLTAKNETDRGWLSDRVELLRC
jgi:hypothetical protein